MLGDFVTESAAKRIEEDVGPLPAGPIEPPLPDPRKGLKGNGGGNGGGGGDGGCAHCSTDPNATGLGAMGIGLVVLLGGLGWRRRRREH